MSRPTLNEKQMNVYKCLVDGTKEGFPPTVREICAVTGIKSTSTVHRILSELEEMGYISRDSRSSRAIKVEGMSNAVQVPLIGKVTAGKPILAVEEIVDYIPYSSGKRSDGMFALNVSGLSMKNAGILDGDIVIADKNQACYSGDIVIAMDGEEATVKRLLIEGKKIILMPENPDFDPIYPEHPIILGKVIGSFRRY